MFFYGHPPLSMWLHSKFLILLGNYLLVDKIFSVFIIILTSIVISLISKIEGLKYYWLPILLWFTNPLIFWAATNNVLENLLSFFVALSILFFVLSNKKILFLYAYYEWIGNFRWFIKPKDLLLCFHYQFHFFIFCLIKVENFGNFLNKRQ